MDGEKYSGLRMFFNCVVSEDISKDILVFELRFE